LTLLFLLPRIGRSLSKRSVANASRPPAAANQIKPRF
jgi:hypothetical protein